MRLDGKREMQYLHRRKGLFWSRGEEDLIDESVFGDPNGSRGNGSLVHGHNHADGYSGRSQCNPWTIIKSAMNTALRVRSPRVRGQGETRLNGWKLKEGVVFPTPDPPETGCQKIDEGSCIAIQSVQSDQ